MIKRKSSKSSQCFFIFAVAVFLLTFGFLLGTAPGVVSAQEQVEADLTPWRIHGQNRFITAVEVARESAILRRPDAVILARGDDAGDFADGLASGVLSSVRNAPVLLTPPDVLPEDVRKVIGELREEFGVDTVYLLGGEAAISGGIHSWLEEEGYEVIRICGANRHVTAKAVAVYAKESATLAGEEFSRKAYIVSGTAPADSLIAGPVAAKNRNAVLQVKRDSIPDVTIEAISELGIEEVVIVGGEGVVGAAVEAQLKEELGEANVSRVGGANRIETSLLFAKSEAAGASSVIFIGSRHIADGLAGSYFGYLLGAPIVYMTGDDVPDSVNVYIKEHILRDVEVGLAVFLGGIAAVSQAVAEKVHREITGRAGVREPVLPPPYVPEGQVPQLCARSRFFLVEGGNLYAQDWWRTNVFLAEAPDFLEPGNYYLIDQEFNFFRWTSDAGTEEIPVGQFDFRKEIPYLLFDLNIPASLTASELCKAIGNSPSPRRQDSPLRGLTGEFIRAQETWGMNAVFLVALTALESGWGTSEIAVVKKNLFGFRAYEKDHFYFADTFASKEDSIRYVSGFIKSRYLCEDGMFYHGANLWGVNTRYAADPMWSVKIARVMNQLYPYGGAQHPDMHEPTGFGAVFLTYWMDDPANAVPVPLNMRSEPSTVGGAETVIGKLSLGTVVEILAEEYNAAEGRLWYKVRVDIDVDGNIVTKEGWVASEYIVRH